MTHKFQIPIKTSPNVIIGSDYSQQEPKVCCVLAQDKAMIKSFQDGKDIYATIAGLAYNQPYEKCLEFNPETHAYQPDGKEMRDSAKTIVLGILYGRSVQTIGEQLYGKDKSLSDEDRTKKAQRVYDSVLKAFPGLRDFMFASQNMAHELGYVTTITGRRRHIPEMMLDDYDFKPMPGYVNPDVDPLDPSTLANSDQIPDRIVKALKKEYAGYKYYGQIVKRNKELHEKYHIQVINNTRKKGDASRECVNCFDTETEILTLDGWKRYDEVSVGDEIISYSFEKGLITHDAIQNVFIYPGDHEVVEFNTPTFHSVTTPNHKWVVYNPGKSSENKIDVKTTENIEKNRWPDYPILRVADNDFPENDLYSDSFLYILGIVLTDGYINTSTSDYAIEIYQSCSSDKNKGVYQNIINSLADLNWKYSDNSSTSTSGSEYHTIYLNKNDTTSWIFDYFHDRTLTLDFIWSLSQRQANVLMNAMVDGDGWRTHHDTKDGGQWLEIGFSCNSKLRAEMFQILCYVSGYASNIHYESGEDAKLHPSYGKHYPSTGNKPVLTSSDFWTVSIYNIKKAQIYPHHKSRKHVDTVWCVETGNHTMVVRRDNHIYLSHNSRVQGSAADMTKMALIKIVNDPRMEKLHAHIIVPVHDEILIIAPEEYAEEAGEVLSSNMQESGSFMPFPISCDVETSYRWYGLSYPCPYKRPESIHTTDPEEVKWLQYCLFEMEYILPIYKDENGEKPKGDAAKGVNGVISDEMLQAIKDYKMKWKVDDDHFIEDIWNRVDGYDIEMVKKYD